MAHKKAGGSAHNLKDSQSQRLGVKLFGGETAKIGSIIIRQRGTKFHPGKGVLVGKDYTIFASQAGVVQFQTKKRKRFDGSLKMVKFVHVVPGEVKAEKVARKVVKKSTFATQNTKKNTKKVVVKRTYPRGRSK